MHRCRTRCVYAIFILPLLVAGCGTVVAPRTVPTPTAIATVATPLPTTATSIATSAPTVTVASWQTVQRFAGTGEQHTPLFAVPTRWQIVYACTDGLLAIEVFNAHGVIVDPVAAQATCPITNVTMEQNLGTPVSLDITGNGKAMWVVQVQEFQ